MYTRVHALKAPIWYRLTTKSVFFILTAVFCALLVMYVYLVHTTIMNVVAEGNAQKSISTLSSSLGDMEFKYISAKSAVTIDLAYEKGFKDTAPSQFISSNPTLTYNY